MSYIYLTLDEKSEVLRNLRKGWGAFQELYERVEKDRLTDDARDIYVSSCEFATADSGRALGYQSSEIRSRSLEEAYAYIEQLERQLTSKDINQLLAEKLRFLTEQIKDWWRTCGFHQISQIVFTQYGHCEVTFSCALSFQKPRTPEQKKAYQDLLSSLPYNVIQVIGEEIPVLVDHEKNRKLLTHLLKSRFASIRIIKWDNEFQEIEKQFKLCTIHCMIYKLGDI